MSSWFGFGSSAPSTDYSARQPNYNPTRNNASRRQELAAYQVAAARAKGVNASGRSVAYSENFQPYGRGAGAGGPRAQSVNSRSTPSAVSSYGVSSGYATDATDASSYSSRSAPSSTAAAAAMAATSRYAGEHAAAQQAASSSGGGWFGGLFGGAYSRTRTNRKSNKSNKSSKSKKTHRKSRRS